MKTRGTDRLSDLGSPKLPPPLDPDFRPASLANRAFREAVRASGKGVPLAVALERGDGQVAAFSTQVFPPESDWAGLNLPYAERLVKFLLWQKGGWRVIVSGQREIGDCLRAAFAPGGPRAFDSGFMSRVYERPFAVEIAEIGEVPSANETAVALGGHLDGCRIGFDLGASDRKVAAVIDGRVVFGEEVIWNPKDHGDPVYHYHQIQSALHHAASFMPRVDAIGGSSAGIYLANRVRVASLFRAVPPDVFEAKVKDLFLTIQRDWGVPLEVINDGEVTALAGAMSLADRAVLGVAMGSSQAAGYVTPEGKITGWLNELAFAPVDYRADAPVDEWSGDRGCGVQYFSQEAVIRLAAAAGITFDKAHTSADMLKAVQALQAEGDERARSVFATIGRYLGYAVAHYAEFYDLRHLLILGRVTSGAGGQVILDQAELVLGQEFPELTDRVKLHLPEEESERRIGQAIAAASLPWRRCRP